MRLNRPFRPLARALARTAPAAVAAGAVALALGAAGCDDSHRGALREERTASAIPLGVQAVVRVETRSADVHLVLSPDDTVRVLAVKRIQSGTARSAEALLRQVKVTMERQGDQLVLRVREPERVRARVSVDAGPWRIRRSTEIELTVAVPARARIEGETARGDFDAVGLTQAVSIVTTAGDVELSQIAGPSRVQCTSGDVTLRDLGQAAIVRVTAGDVDASGVVGGLTVRATSGDVVANNIRGATRIETSTGDVDTHTLAGPVLISTSAGEIVLQDAAADSLVLETASGDIEAGLVSGPHYVQIRSSSGTVSLDLPVGTGGLLDLQTGSGSIQVKSAVQVETMNRNRLTGRLGGAGTVAVRTSSGDITLAATSGGQP